MSDETRKTHTTGVPGDPAGSAGSRGSGDAPAHAEHAGSGSPSTADQVVEGLHRIDEKVDRLRENRLNDPDSLGDKIFKWAAPSLVGFVTGKLFQLAWDRGAGKRNARKGLEPDAPQGLLAGLVFAASSAAFGAVVSQLSDRGSKAFVDRRHAKRQARRAGRDHRNRK